MLFMFKTPDLYIFSSLIFSEKTDGNGILIYELFIQDTSKTDWFGCIVFSSLASLGKLRHKLSYILCVSLSGFGFFLPPVPLN